MKPKATHTEFRKGTKVSVKMRDGRIIRDRYEEKKSGVVILRDQGRVQLSEVQNITFDRFLTRTTRPPFEIGESDETLAAQVRRKPRTR